MINVPFPSPGARFEPQIAAYHNTGTAPLLSFREIIDSLTSEQAQDALQQLRQMLRQYQKSSDREPMAWILLHMAMVMRGQRQHAELPKILDEAKGYFSSINNDFGRACVLLEMSMVNREMDRNTLALEYAHDSIRLLQNQGPTLELAFAYDNLARVYLNRLQRHESLIWAKKARDIFSQLQSKQGYAWNACNLGGLYFQMGFHAEAIQNYEEALAIFENLNSKQGSAWALLGLATVHRARCDFDFAIKELSKAQMLFQQLDLKDRAAWCLLHSGAIERMLGHQEDAIALNKKAMKVFAALRNHDGVAWSFFQLGQIANDRGLFVKSWETLREGLNLHTHIANPEGIGWGENEIGKIYLHLNNLSLARESFIKVKVTADQIDAPSLKAEVDKNLAHYYIDQGMLKRGYDSLMNAEAVSAKVQAMEVELEVLLCRIRYGLVVRDLPLARASLEKANQLIANHNLHHVNLKLGLLKAEILVNDDKEEESLAIFDSVRRLSEQGQFRYTHIEATLGYIQLVRNKRQDIDILSTVRFMDKHVRAMGSRKLRAKLMALKALLDHERGAAVDTRFLAQAVDTADKAGLVLLKWQFLALFADICNQAGEKAAAEEFDKERTNLEGNTNYDVKMAHGRRPFLKSLPISVVS
jgi:tetratricopeptide (TPR) repeat protein